MVLLKVAKMWTWALGTDRFTLRFFGAGAALISVVGSVIIFYFVGMVVSVIIIF